MWLSPGIPPACPERTRLVDIAPTLAHAVGLHLPAQGSVMTEVFTAPVRPEDV